MATRSWRASGAAARAPGRGPRPAGSWAASIARARQAWDGLGVPSSGCYSDTATAAILALAVALWPDTAASMGEEDGDEDVG